MECTAVSVKTSCTQFATDINKTGIAGEQQQGRGKMTGTTPAVNFKRNMGDCLHI